LGRFSKAHELVADRQTLYITEQGP
jgi:hypothetical protein